jgi:hypothetical protein
MGVETLEGHARLSGKWRWGHEVPLSEAATYVPLDER